MAFNQPSVTSNDNSHPMRRLTEVEQALRQQSSSFASSSSNSDLQIDQDYQRDLQHVLFVEERNLQLERQSRWCQQHLHLQQQQREEEMSLDYNNDIDSLVYSVSVNGSTASLIDSRSDNSRMVSPVDRMKMNLMSRVQDGDEVVSTMESELDDTVVSGCTRRTTQSDTLTAKVISPWCSFMGAIIDHGEDTKCEAREAVVGNMLFPCIRTHPGKKDDMSAITRITYGSIESDLSELTDHIKLIMAYSAKRDTQPHFKKGTSSAKTLAEKLEAVNRNTVHKVDTVHEVDPAMNKGRKEAARQISQQHQGKVESEPFFWQGFWKGDAVWSSDQSTACGEVHRSSNLHLFISDYDRATASSRFLSFTDKAKATATETIHSEIDATKQASRQADINKAAYAQAQQGIAGARSSFWKDDGVWSSDQSTAFGSLHSTHGFRPRINEYDEAIVSSPYLSFARKKIAEQETDTSSCWKAAIDVSSGKTYYYHSKTRETSWSMPSDYSTARQREKGAFPEEMEDKIESRDSIDADVLTSRKKMNEERDEHCISLTNNRRQQHPVTQAPDQEQKTLSRRQRFSLFRMKKGHNTSTIDPASPDHTLGTSLESRCSDDDGCDGITRFSC